MAGSRIFYRLVKSGASVSVKDGVLLMDLPAPLADEQRQAISNHKDALLDLAEWYTDDAGIITGMPESEFLTLATDYLSTMGGLIRTATSPARETVQCAGCQHYQRTNHPRLGHCIQGEIEAVVGLWDSDRRLCESYRAGGSNGSA